jgi:hypothetical protein
MFQFPSWASCTYGFSAGSRGFAAGGFPIRKSPGQSLLGGSPELFAACHVLHRLLTPGHPPCALVRLTTTQRMKEIRTTPSESVVKERGRDASRPDTRKSERRRGLDPQVLRRIGKMVEVNGIEPMASWLQTRRSPN